MDVSPGGTECLGEVFVSIARGRVNPTNAHPVANGVFRRTGTQLDHVAYHLVPEHNRQVRRRRAPFDFVELRMANTAASDLH
jgi:hypothetical protein